MQKTLLSLAIALLVTACNSDGTGIGTPDPAAGGSTGGGGGTGGGSGGGDAVELSEDHRVAVVYTADNAFRGLQALFAAARSGRILNLTHPLGATYTVALFALSPDQAWVAVAVEDGPDSGLYIVAVNKSEPLRVSPAGEHKVEEIAWSRDSAQVAYRATVGGLTRLFLVDRDGGNHREIGGGEVASRILWSSDGSYLAFHSDRVSDDQHELYVILPNGTGAQQLSQTLAPAGTFRWVSYSWAPEGNCLAFRSDMEQAGVFELYVADLTTSPPTVTRVSTEGAAGNVPSGDWKWFPDGSELLYRRDAALFRVSKAGGDARKVADGPVDDYAASPDGSLFAVLVDDTRLLTGDGVDPLVEVASAAGRIRDFAWAPDSQWLAYRATDADPLPLLPMYEVLVVPASGVAAPESLTGAGSDVRSYAWAARPVPQLAGLAQIIPWPDYVALYAYDHASNYATLYEFGDAKFKPCYYRLRDRTEKVHFGPSLNLIGDLQEPSDLTAGGLSWDFYGAANQGTFLARLHLWSPTGPSAGPFVLGGCVEDWALLDRRDPPEITVDLTHIHFWIGDFMGFGGVPPLGERFILFTYDERALGIGDDDAALIVLPVFPLHFANFSVGTGTRAPDNQLEFSTFETLFPSVYEITRESDDPERWSVKCYPDAGNRGEGQEAKVLPEFMRVTMIWKNDLDIRLDPRDPVTMHAYPDEDAEVLYTFSRAGEKPEVFGRVASLPRFDSEEWLLVRRQNGQEGWIRFRLPEPTNPSALFENVKLPDGVKYECLTPFDPDAEDFSPLFPGR